MDRGRRVYVLTAALFVVITALAFQAVTADPTSSGTVRTAPETNEGDTLITVQSFGWFTNNNGKALIVNRSGTVIWEYDPPESRVFDAEQLPNGNILLAVATGIPAEQCPPEYQNTSRYADHCLENRVIEVNYDTNEVEWEYSWFDLFLNWHEVHDVDRLPSGETAIIDMGKDRAFTVNQAGEITWEWRAREHLAPGTTFWDTYIPEDDQRKYRPSPPEGDWTHMNDIDQLPNGNFQLSIRNFDVIIEVDPLTDRIVNVIGRPGTHEIMQEQHDPHRLTGSDTILVADSKNDRIVEMNPETGELLWSYTGGLDSLQWPRDADRLPNGNTLIADSRNFRVLEINENNSVVWEYSLRTDQGIVYDVDRLGIPEEPAVEGTHRPTTLANQPILLGLFHSIISWTALLLPRWVGLPELVTGVLGLVIMIWLIFDVIHLARHRS